MSSHPEVRVVEPNPGTREAIDSGCKCPVLDNRRGLGYYAAPDGVFCYSQGCPIHWPLGGCRE